MQVACFCFSSTITISIQCSFIFDILIFPKIRSSTDIELVVYGEIFKAPLDYVLCYCDTIALKTPKSREKNDCRRHFDYCGITTTEYK